MIKQNSAYQNVLRWWNNIASYKSEFASLPAGSASAAPAAAAEEDDDDVDLFASDDEVDEEAEKIKVSFFAPGKMFRYDSDFECLFLGSTYC